MRCRKQGPGWSARHLRRRSLIPRSSARQHMPLGRADPSHDSAM